MLTLVLAVLALFAPGMAYAAGGGNVVLEFQQRDYIYLFVSLGFGVLALLAAWALARGVLAHTPGNEKMQEVGAAIKSGALAYLRQQVRTMMIFVVILAIGLGFLFASQFTTTVGLWVAGSFVLGVSASYIAGYAGMIMAVNGNTRTAAAALTSYKTSLEVAFRSGGVAGLLTVGMGLIGAVAIFLGAGADAMKALIGFGFGGSLAALFMRVGGGIFTKAADVGADLVGKVEAGIPEDDPRNPAVIADNVGDNVGDCAGMAADVFESYEVTLVAAIVLGAATAAIFDQSTWMKLVLFALMARGVGIVASIIGIFSVKGNDDLNSDPLRAIRRGFTSSAAIAALLTLGLAWFMLGGTGQNQVITSQLNSLEEQRRDEIEAIQRVQDKLQKEMQTALAVRNRLAGDNDPTKVSLDDIRKAPEVVATSLDEKEREATLKRIQAFPKGKITVEDFDIEATDIQADPSIVALGLNKEEDLPVIQQAQAVDLAQQPLPRSLKGYTKVDLDDKDSPAARYSTMLMGDPQTQQRQQYQPLNEAFKKERFVVYHLKITQPGTPPPTQPGQPAPPRPPDVVRELRFGPVQERIADEQIKQARTGGMKIDVLNKYPVTLFANDKGDLAVGIEPKPIGSQREVPLPFANRIGGGQITYFRADAATMNSIAERQTTDPTVRTPSPVAIDLATVEHKLVPWYLFFLCILFGILMAFAFELLTDYYVSTHKRPVQEVGNVASAGPAPMIIQGFAYGLESSVFSVLAIVAALIAPLLIFPADVFGGYILSFYGIALVGLGLLTTTGYILAMDTFGPISDNAQGVFEMSGAGHTHPEASRAVQRLDAAGNTTKALTKGFAIATAVVAAVALFHSYIEDAKLAGTGLPLDVPEIFLGLLIGGAAPFLFSAFSINAVGRAAFDLINEVRRQFRADAGIMAGTSKPDYGRCVAIVTAAAQKELLGPGLLAIGLPLVVAFGFSIGKQPVMIDGQLYNLTGAQALGGFLAGTILSGQLMAVLLANSGGIWDNAKKLIEDGLHGGKGTEAHKAGVVCDTVGDPFKDTAGPALNPLIKVMNLVALLLVGAIITPWSQGVLIGVTAAAFAMLVVAFWWSKRGSMSSELTAAQGPPSGGSALPPQDSPVAMPASDSPETTPETRRD